MAGRLSNYAGWRQRWTVLIAKIERVETPTDEEHLLHRMTHPVKPMVVAFANAHAMNSLAISPTFFEALGSADWILRDGSGMATLFKLMKMSPGLNLNGSDLIPRIVQRFNGCDIALFGTRDPYLQRGLKAAALKLAPHSTYVSAHGFLEIGAYVDLAAMHRPALIVLGMGMPRQEAVAAALRSQLTFPCLVVCGGAIIDFLAGRTPRAPVWMRRAGIEWLFRLAMEPRRLFQRYVIGNPVFLTRAIYLAARGSR